MSAKSSKWFGWLNLAFCLMLYAGMWYFYGLVRPFFFELKGYTDERWTTFGPVVGYGLVGALILAYRPWHRVGLVFSLVSTTQAVAFFATPYTIYAFRMASEPMPLAPLLYSSRGLWVILLISISILLLTFPDGELLSNKWAWYYRSIWIATGLILVVEIFLINPLEAPAQPFVGVDEPQSSLLILIPGYYLLISPLISLAAIIQRWRHAAGIQKAQIKWLAMGGLVSVLSLSANFLVDFFNPGYSLPDFLEAVIGNLVFMTLPVFVGLGILRYRLFDIDLIIRRTLVYSLMTGLLALLYFGSVTVLQGIFTALGGSRSTVATVLSTLGIAVLFTPLRRKAQDFIDWRFYRRRYDSEQALAEFSAAARDEVEIGRLTSALIASVEGTVQPTAVSLWLRDPEENKHDR